jgi:hypothetical protein
LESPFYEISVIGKSTTSTPSSLIKLFKARTVSLTVRLTCGASLDVNPTVNVYYLPDENNRDTIPYTSFTLTNSAGNTIQRTVLIDPPEHGSFCITITNGSSADSITNVKAWYSVQSWE